MCLFQFWLPQGICRGVGQLGNIVVWFLVFQGISIPSSIMALSIYIPTNSARGFSFYTSSPAFIACRFFDDGHSDQCEIISHCSFDLYFSDNEWCWHIFMCLLAIWMSSLEKRLLRSFPHVFTGLFVFLVLSSMSCMYILEINPLSIVSLAIIFSHSEGCLFTLIIVYFAVQKLLSLIRSHLFTFFLKFHYSRRWAIEYLALIYAIECSANVFLQ